MRIAIQKDTRQVVSWANEAIDSLSATRRDKFPVEVRFIEGAGYAALPAGAAGRLTLKLPGDYAGTPRVVTTAWAISGTGRNTIYTFPVDLNTQELATLFAQEPASISLVLEIEWVYNQGGLTGIRQTSVPVPVLVANDYIRENDGLPVAALDLKATQAEAEAGVSNEKWMTPLRTAQAIAELAPPTTDASLLTFGTLADARLSGPVTASLAKADTASQPGHGHAISDVANLATALDTKVTAYMQGGDTPVPGLAPAAIELHDLGYGGTALKLDSNAYNGADPDSPNPWEVRLPDQLRKAIDAQKAGSYATLVDGLVPSTQLPSYVDDVLEYSRLGDFPVSGETGKIYVAKNDGLIVSATGFDAIDGFEGQTGIPVFQGGSDLGGRVSVVGGQIVVTDSGAGYAAGQANFSSGTRLTLAVGDGLSRAYRWTGSTYLEISPSEVTSVAGRTGAVTLTSADITDFTSAVAAAAPAPSTSANSGLSITGTALATSYNTAIADTVVSVPVGGAPAAAASTWKSKNLVQVLDDILFPTILASVGSAKSLDLAVSGTSGTLEIGTSVSRILTATFARGTILNGNGSTNSNPLVGAATGYTFTGTGISSTAQAGNTLSFTTPVVSGSNNWAVTATHAVGTGTYQDNKGVAGTNLDASRAAGSLTDSTSSPAITGVHPYYYLKSASPITAASMAAAIGNGTATKVIASSTGTLSIPYAPTAEYFAVAYPSTSTTKTRYFVTALDNGAITVVFSPVATQTVTTTLWTQDYRIHVTTAALTNSNSTIELRNT